MNAEFFDAIEEIEREKIEEKKEEENKIEDPEENKKKVETKTIKKAYYVMDSLDCAFSL